jgi:hypothetical protein
MDFASVEPAGLLTARTGYARRAVSGPQTRTAP